MCQMQQFMLGLHHFLGIIIYLLPKANNGVQYLLPWVGSGSFSSAFHNWAYMGIHDNWGSESCCDIQCTGGSIQKFSDP